MKSSTSSADAAAVAATDEKTVMTRIRRSIVRKSYRRGCCNRFGSASLPPGLLVLRRELLAGLDPERRIRRQDAIGIHVLIHEVEGILGDDVASEFEGRRIQRETLDDVQLVAVRE